jgi:hypothetical protein
MVFLVRDLCASLVTSPGIFSGDKYEVKLSVLRLQQFAKVIAIARFVTKQEITVDPPGPGSLRLYVESGTL